MNVLPSFALFVMLVFGVGWTSHMVAERMSAPDAPSHRSRSMHGMCGHGGDRGGPFLQSVEEFADELRLTDSQKEGLARCIEATAAKVREQECAMFAIYRESRRETEELLSEAQLDRLGQLIDAKWESFRGQKIRAVEDWLTVETSIAADSRARVVEIVREFEQRKGELFRALHRGDDPLAFETIESRMHDLAEQRDQRLAAWLTKDRVDEFRRFSREWRPEERR